MTLCVLKLAARLFQVTPAAPNDDLSLKDSVLRKRLGSQKIVELFIPRISGKSFSFRKAFEKQFSLLNLTYFKLRTPSLRMSNEHTFVPKDGATEIPTFC